MIDELLELIEVNIKATCAFMNGGSNDIFWEGKIAGLTLMRDEIRRLTRASSGLAQPSADKNSSASAPTAEA